MLFPRLSRHLENFKEVPGLGGEVATRRTRMQTATGKRRCRRPPFEREGFLAEKFTEPLAGGTAGGRQGSGGGQTTTPPTRRPRSDRTHQLHRSRGEDAPPGPAGAAPPRRRPPAETRGAPGAGGGRGVLQAGPSRAASAPTHIPRRRAPGLAPRGRSRPPPRRSPRLGAQGPSGGGGRTNSGASRAPAQPVSARGSRGRPPLRASAPLPLSFLQPTHRSHSGQPGGPSQASSPLSPRPHRLRGASGGTGSDAPPRRSPPPVRPPALRRASGSRGRGRESGARSGTARARVRRASRAALLRARARRGAAGGGHARRSRPARRREPAETPGASPGRAGAGAAERQRACGAAEPAGAGAGAGPAPPRRGVCVRRPPAVEAAGSESAGPGRRPLPAAGPHTRCPPVRRGPFPFCFRFQVPRAADLPFPGPGLAARGEAAPTARAAFPGAAACRCGTPHLCGETARGDEAPRRLRTGEGGETKPTVPRSPVHSFVPQTFAELLPGA